MAIVNATSSWASVTTTNAEYWQVRTGMIEISDATGTDGVILTSDEELGTIIRIAAERTVWYRSHNGATAQFARSAVA